MLWFDVQIIRDGHTLLFCYFVHEQFLLQGNTLFCKGTHKHTSVRNRAFFVFLLGWQCSTAPNQNFCPFAANFVVFFFALVYCYIQATIENYIAVPPDVAAEVPETKADVPPAVEPLVCHLLCFVFLLGWQCSTAPTHGL